MGFIASEDMLKDRVILITGAGEGLGYATSRLLAAHGATLILLGRTIPKLEKLYDEICDQGHPEPALYPMNLEGATLKDFQDLAATLDKEFGQLHGLIHNAATLGHLSPLQHADAELWYRVMQVNFYAPAFMTQSCLGLLNAADQASLIFISDSVGRRAKAYWGAYAASKFALEGLMQTVADEVEVNTQIRVNSLDPGPMRTRLRRQAYPGEDAATLVPPDAIAPQLLYLFSQQARDLHGQQLTRDALARRLAD